MRNTSLNSILGWFPKWVQRSFLNTGSSRKVMSSGMSRLGSQKCNSKDQNVWPPLKRPMDGHGLLDSSNELGCVQTGISTNFIPRAKCMATTPRNQCMAMAYWRVVMSVGVYRLESQPKSYQGPNVGPSPQEPNGWPGLI